MGLRDIGGGFQVIDLSKGESKETQPANVIKEQLTLQNLVNQIQRAPLERQRLEQQVRQADVDFIKSQVDLERSRAQSFFDYNNEARSQAKFFTDQIKELPTLFQQSFELGNQVLQRTIPGATAVQNEDGTISVAVPGANQVTKAITIDPNRISSPEKRAGLEENMRKEFNANAKDFKTQSQFFRNLRSLSNLATAQADIGIVFSYMKLLDPGSVVREGEQATARNAPGVPEQIRNMYNRALTQDAPLFGEKGSRTRAKFVEAGEVLYDTAKGDTLQNGQFFVDLAERSGLDPRNVVQPVGDLKYQDFVESAAQEAGEGQVTPGNAPPAPDVPIELELNELLQNIYED